MTPLAGEVLRAAAVGTVFLLIFAAAELWKRLANPPAEWTRKAVHVGGGMVSLTLPWLFRSHWTVLALGLAFAGILLGTRRLGMLGSVHGVARHSEGGVFFPLAIYLIFLIGHEQPVFYFISVLVLVLSDALAALVGTAYGRMTYSVEEGRRSMEGSVVFLLTTFLGVHLPLLLWTGLDPAASVLIALQIALLVTFLEAICVRGSDNLVIPLGTFYFLTKMTPRTAEFIAEQLVAQLAIFGLLLLLAWRSRFLTASGTLAATLFFYGAWSLGGAEWIVAPAVGLAVFWGIFRRFGARPARPDARYQVVAVFYTSIVAGAWFILNNAFEMIVRHPVLGRGDPFYPLYLGTLAAHLAMLALVFLPDAPWIPAPAAARWLAAFATGFLAVVPPGLIVARFGHGTQGALVAATVCAVALVFYGATRRWSDWPHHQPWDVRLQALCAAMAGAVVLPLELPAFT